MIYGFIETKDGNIYEWELHPVFFAKWDSWIEYVRVEFLQKSEGLYYSNSKGNYRTISHENIRNIWSEEFDD